MANTTVEWQGKKYYWTGRGWTTARKDLGDRDAGYIKTPPWFRKGTPTVVTQKIVRPFAAAVAKRKTATKKK